MEYQPIATAKGQCRQIYPRIADKFAFHYASHCRKISLPLRLHTENLTASQTNGMVERFNGRISELIEQTRFDSRSDLEATLLNYLKLYNHHIPQRAIGSTTPI
jgi:transposase InsO family protein